MSHWGKRPTFPEASDRRIRFRALRPNSFKIPALIEADMFRHVRLEESVLARLVPFLHVDVFIEVALPKDDDDVFESSTCHAPE